MSVDKKALPIPAAKRPSSVGSSFLSALVGHTCVQAIHRVQGFFTAIIAGLARFSKPSSNPCSSMHLFGQTLAHSPQPIHDFRKSSSANAPGGRKKRLRFLPPGNFA